MNPLIEQFKKSMEGFEEKFAKAKLMGKDDLTGIRFEEYGLKNDIKLFFYQSTLNLINKMIEERDKYSKAEEIVEVGKRYLVVNGDKFPFGYPYPDTKEKYALSDTISQLQEFKAWLEQQL